MTGGRMRRTASLILCLVIAMLPVCTAVAGRGGGRRHEKAPAKTHEEVTLITCQPEAVQSAGAEKANTTLTGRRKWSTCSTDMRKHTA